MTSLLENGLDVFEALTESKTMIYPFLAEKLSERKGQRVPSFGLSHCGYDFTLAPHWRVAKHNQHMPLDVNSCDQDHLWYEDHHGEEIVIPAHGFVLAYTNEYWNLPNDLMAMPACKSTLARRGVTMPPTVVEPGWQGQLVVEITNANPFPVTIHANTGAGQMLFFKMSEPTHGYEGKYQGQTGITGAKM